MRSYWPAIAASLLGHGVLIGFVLWGWNATAVTPEVKKPAYIKATLVQLEEKAKPKKVTPQPKPPKKKDDKKALEKKKLQEKKRKEKKLAEKKAREKKQAEEKRKNQLAKKKAEEKAAEEKRQKEQEKQRKEDLQKELERERQQELERTIAAEKARQAAEQQAAEDAIVAQSYNHIIDKKVSDNWSRPPSARNDMAVLLRIQLVPTGEVVGVDVMSSSGNAAFDRSAIRAVKKAERFPELQQLSSRIFEKNFRVFKLLFEPRDLRQ
jgi:colicin import membrane protein